MRMKRKEKKKKQSGSNLSLLLSSNNVDWIGLIFLHECFWVCSHYLTSKFQINFLITIWPSLNKNWNFRLHYILFKITTSNKFTRKFLIFKNFPLYFRFKIGPKLFCQFFNSSIFFSFSNKSMHLNRIRVIFDIFAEILQFFKIVNKKRFYFKSAS